ncbi:MAG: arylesterase [Proteobacteria bacterium]|nr:arylesterase [Pseudomonadota bacterium]
MTALLILLSCFSEAPPVKEETIAKEETVVIEEHPRVIILGDSLTAGYGLPVDQAYPNLLQENLLKADLPTEILNAGISGDTTAGGARRLEWLLKQKPDLLILELGANDGLRGAPIKDIEQNLRSIIEETQKQGFEVLLVGMRIPPNYGEDYALEFADIYPKLAQEYSLLFVPFLLKDVAGDPTLNQADGIHPTSEGHKILAQNVFPTLIEWRKKIK